MEEKIDEGISFLDVIKIIKRHLIGISVCFIVSICLALCYLFFISKPTYVATASVIVNASEASTKPNQDTTSLAYGLNIVNTYIDFVYTDLVNDAVRNKVKPKDAYSVKTVNNQSSLIVKIKVSSKNMDEAITIANQYVTESLSIINSDGSSYAIMKAACINGLDYADVDNVSVQSRAKIIILVGLLIGIVSSIAYIVIKHSINNTFNNLNEIEQETDLKLLGVIPDIMG